MRATILAKTIVIGVCVLTVAGCSGGSAGSPTPAGAVHTAALQPSASLPPVATATAPATIAAVVATATPVAAASPAAGGRIAFGLKGADGNVQIVSAEPNGADLQKLTSGTGFHACPSYSADRSQIAYCSTEGGNLEIWTMRSDGTKQAQLTHLGGSAEFPAFSPDGHFVAFGGTEGSDSQKQIDLVDAVGGGSLQTLTSCAGYKPGCLNSYPAWSPDGKSIAFIHAEDSDADGNPINEQVWVMDANGGHAHALTSSPAAKDEVPEWSPDGSRIAYESGSGGSGGIWVMNADGSKAKQLSGCAATDPAPCAQGDDFGPAWSPDGRQIAFARDLQGLGQADRPVMIMNADGTDQHRLMAAPAIEYVPAW